MKNNGYYNEKNMEKFGAALIEYANRIKNGEKLHVSISNANSKMGNVSSVSTLPFLTCPARCADTCGGKCYAAKLAALRPTVLKAYAKNTALALFDPVTYWEEIGLAVSAVRFFRFHVSGDIINAQYFENMVKTARKNPKTEILVFTKRYEIVNAWTEKNGEIPANLHILFSGWNNLECINPHGLPETTVFANESEIRENWKICGGNCFNCACRGLGCWQAKKGETIAFKLH